MIKTKLPGILLLSVLIFFNRPVKAQGSWTPLNNLAPDTNVGVMLLLSDGTVMAKTLSCACDTIGNVWNKLTPDSLGSYINGTWTRLAPMHDTRLYFASQVLKDGRVFVAGGEYGSGGYKAETYNPLTDTWTMAPNLNRIFADANSEILEDGRVIVGILDGNGDNTAVFDPKTNTWATGATCRGNHDESAWVKLPDNSILFVDIGSTNSERYIPSLDQWIPDAQVPVYLYDFFWYESGAGILLPNGGAFFLGSTGHSAIYTPSGNNNPGIWNVGPDLPVVLGKQYGTVDAAAAMMVNGKILCCASPVNTDAVIDSAFYAPTAFYEFDYLNNTFTPIPAPDGTDALTNVACFESNMLDLPDGTVLYATQYTQQYYIYTPDGSPLPGGKPAISTITQMACDTFRATGTLFNGISEGAAYGDDWQMASNYPLVRLSNATNVYYARTFNWNSTGVQRGTLPDTTTFTLPPLLPLGTYSLVVIANGISSDPVTFVNTACVMAGINNPHTNTVHLSAYPNPTEGELAVSFTAHTAGSYTLSLTDLFGRTVMQRKAEAAVGDNRQTLLLNGIAPGVYMLAYRQGNELVNVKVVVE